MPWGIVQIRLQFSVEVSAVRSAHPCPMTDSLPRPRRSVSLRATPFLGLLLANPAAAAFLAGEALDTAADVMSWVVLFLVPAIAIVVFWVVHVMPEKIAHKRHHPQQQAIQTLCLLSLFFGGLLWPIAWLWAYTKPVAHKAAYGTDKSEDYYVGELAKAQAGNLSEHELVQLETELDEMSARAALPAQLRAAWAEMRAARRQPAAEGGSA